MTKKKVKVQKALAPEEITILDNVASLLEQLKGGGVAAEEVLMADDESITFTFS